MNNTTGINNGVEMNNEIEMNFDIGRSGLRTYDGKLRFTVADPAYKKIPADSFIRHDIKDPYTDFKILMCPKEELKGVRIVKGQAMSLFNATIEQADNGGQKSEQEETFVNFIYATMMELVERLHTDVEDPEIKYGLCIPVSEAYSSKSDELKDALDGRYMVNIPILKKSISWSVHSDNINILPEGPAAMIPLFDNDEYAELIENEMGIIIDAGYGSVDDTLIKDGETQGATATSDGFGGMTFENNVMSLLDRKSYPASKGNVKTAITKGFVKKGTVNDPVGIIVKECKEKYADKLKSDVLSLISTEFVRQAELSWFYPIGRSFTKSTGEDAFNTGDLSKIFSDKWGYEIRELEKPELPEGSYCIDRTSFTKDIKNNEELESHSELYKVRVPDINELANVYGIGCALCGEDDDDEENEESEQLVTTME